MGQLVMVSCRLEHLPRYALKLNPIESCWSKLKILLCPKEAHSVDELAG